MVVGIWWLVSRVSCGEDFWEGGLSAGCLVGRFSGRVACQQGVLWGGVLVVVGRVVCQQGACRVGVLWGG